MERLTIPSSCSEDSPRRWDRTRAKAGSILLRGNDDQMVPTELLASGARQGAGEAAVQQLARSWHPLRGGAAQCYGPPWLAYLGSRQCRSFHACPGIRWPDETNVPARQRHRPRRAANASVMVPRCASSSRESNPEQSTGGMQSHSATFVISQLTNCNRRKLATASTHPTTQDAVISQQNSLNNRSVGRSRQVK